MLLNEQLPHVKVHRGLCNRYELESVEPIDGSRSPDCKHNTDLTTICHAWRRAENSSHPTSPPSLPQPPCPLPLRLAIFSQSMERRVFLLCPIFKAAETLPLSGVAIIIHILSKKVNIFRA